MGGSSHMVWPLLIVTRDEDKRGSLGEEQGQLAGKQRQICFQAPHTILWPPASERRGVKDEPFVPIVMQGEVQ